MAQRILRLFQRTVVGWSRNEATVHAAAIAYWLILSVAPLLIVSIAIASQVFAQSIVETQLIYQLEVTFGTPVAAPVANVLLSSRNFAASSLTTGLGIIFLFWTASSVFMQLQTALNAMWGIAPRASSVRESLVHVLKSRVVAAASVLTVGFLLLGSLLLHTFWTALPGPLIDPLVDSLGTLTGLLRFAASPFIYMLLFGLIFKALPQASIRWRDVWPGAALTAVLFWLGGYGIGLYLGYSLLASIYGAAGSIIVFLLWAYYSAWIILFGAKFTQVYAHEFGVPIDPYPYVVFRHAASPGTQLQAPSDPPETGQVGN